MPQIRIPAAETVTKGEATYRAYRTGDVDPWSADFFRAIGWGGPERIVLVGEDGSIRSLLPLDYEKEFGG